MVKKIVSVDEETIRSFKKTKDVVRYILEKKPCARDDDKKLIIYCFRYYGVLNQSYNFNINKFLEVMPSVETIRRVRQEIQNKEGVLLPTTVEICNHRRIRQEVIRRYYRQ